MREDIKGDYSTLCYDRILSHHRHGNIPHTWLYRPGVPKRFHADPQTAVASSRASFCKLSPIVNTM